MSYNNYFAVTLYHLSLILCCWYEYFCCVCSALHPL